MKHKGRPLWPTRDSLQGPEMFRCQTNRVAQFRQIAPRYPPNLAPFWGQRNQESQHSHAAGPSFAEHPNTSTITASYRHGRSVTGGKGRGDRGLPSTPVFSPSFRMDRASPRQGYHPAACSLARATTDPWLLVAAVPQPNSGENATVRVGGKALAIV